MYPTVWAGRENRWDARNAVIVAKARVTAFRTRQRRAGAVAGGARSALDLSCRMYLRLLPLMFRCLRPGKFSSSCSTRTRVDANCMYRFRPR